MARACVLLMGGRHVSKLSLLWEFDVTCFTFYLNNQFSDMFSLTLHVTPNSLCIGPGFLPFIHIHADAIAELFATLFFFFFGIH